MVLFKKWLQHTSMGTIFKVIFNIKKKIKRKQKLTKQFKHIFDNNENETQTIMKKSIKINYQHNVNI